MSADTITGNLTVSDRGNLLGIVQVIADSDSDLTQAELDDAHARLVERKVRESIGAIGATAEGLARLAQGVARDTLSAIDVTSFSVSVDVMVQDLLELRASLDRRSGAWDRATKVSATRADAAAHAGPKVDPVQKAS